MAIVSDGRSPEEVVKSIRKSEDERVRGQVRMHMFVAALQSRGLAQFGATKEEYLEALKWAANEGVKYTFNE